MSRRRGLALILVTGVLGLLAVLAAAFVTMAQLERRASRQRLHATQAQLLARSGLEDALARLTNGQEASLAGTAFAGEDFDNDGSLSPGLEMDAEVFQKGKLNREDCPARDALRPSFFVKDPAGDPAPRPVEGRLRGYSGVLGAGTYALKVTGEDGIYVNGGDPSVPVNPAVPDYNLNLRRMLGILAEAIDREDGVNDGLPTDNVIGWALIDFRPPTGWKDLDAIKALAIQRGFLAKVEPLLPYLTTHARVDRKVIRPNAVPGPFPGMEGTDYRSWADIKLAHEAYPLQPGTPEGKEPGFERIPVLPTGKLVGRAPVDLDWARTRRPVLIALLADLKGLYLDESVATPLASGDRIGTIRSAEIALGWGLPADDCRRVADRILTSTSALRTWDAWDAFCDAIPDTLLTGTTDLCQVKRDLLKANFNPNSRLNKFSPNTSLWKSVDKSDLLVYSTEFSLLPQAGAQALESVGRILGPDGRLLAQRLHSVSIAPAGLLTLSTQKEFVCDDLGDLLVAGDEGALRQPGFLMPGEAPFITEGQGAGEKTWGHRLDVRGLYPGSWMDGDSAGASLQTFPEPVVDTGSGLSPLSTRAADYDGSVQLATIETPEDAWYSVPAPGPPPAVPVRDMKLLARYTATLDLDVSDATPTRPPGDPRWRNQPDVQQVTYVTGLPGDPAQLSYGLLHPTRPNTLYPDGAYSEKDRALSYLDKDNANGIQGLISFWIKSNHALPAEGVVRGHPFLKWTNFVEAVPFGGGARDQFFFLGDVASPSASIDISRSIACQFEIAHSTSDDKKEHRFLRDGLLTPHRWSLITMYYDFRSPDGINGEGRHDCGELRIDAGILGADRGANDTYDSTGNDPVSASDITVDHLISPPWTPEVFGPHSLILGKGRPEGELEMVAHTGSGADATFDELAIYDFGGAGPDGIPEATLDTLDSPGVLAANRFKEGRHCKESAYPAAGLAVPLGADLDGDLFPDRRAPEYFSPPIRLGSPSRIRALAWTQVVPAGLPAGRILLELADPSGGDYLTDASGKRIDQTFDCPAWSPVARTVDAPFRLHAVFQPNLADKENTPILDPLALDDVTVIYEPAGGRRIVAWGGEE